MGMGMQRGTSDVDTDTDTDTDTDIDSYSYSYSYREERRDGIPLVSTFSYFALVFSFLALVPRARSCPTPFIIYF